MAEVGLPDSRVRRTGAQSGVWLRRNLRQRLNKCRREQLSIEERWIQKSATRTVARTLGEAFDGEILGRRQAPFRSAGPYEKSFFQNSSVEPVTGKI